MEEVVDDIIEGEPVEMPEEVVEEFPEDVIVDEETIVQLDELNGRPVKGAFQFT